MRIAKIAVGVDFSPQSDLATRQALALARQLGSELVLVHVATGWDHIVPGSPSSASHKALAALRGQLGKVVEDERAALTDLTELLSRSGPVVSQAMVDGYPDSGLCTAAEELGADLIVVGSHGRTGLSWLLLGSVASRVMRMAHTDVLVARGDNDRDGGFRHLAVSVDFGPQSEQVLRRALLLARPDAVVDVFHFYSDVPEVSLYDAIRSSLDGEVEEIIRAHRDQEGKALLGRCARDGITMNFHALRGHPTGGLIEQLERDSSYDLVALGSHGYRGPRRYLLGSVAEAVSRRAPCSSLVVRSTT